MNWEWVSPVTLLFLSNQGSPFYVALVNQRHGLSSTGGTALSDHIVL
jgi:hypothetical protein